MSNEDIVMLIVLLVILAVGFGYFAQAFFRENKECWRLRKENRNLHRLLEQKIQMDSDYLNACCSMLREVSQSGHDYS